MNKFTTYSLRLLITICLGFFAANAVASDSSVLPSWSNNTSRQNIIEFVEAVTNKSSPNFVPIAERIAVFDNDGTLWSEKTGLFSVTVRD